jgi:hypothetical protein
VSLREPHYLIFYDFNPISHYSQGGYAGVEVNYDRSHFQLSAFLQDFSSYALSLLYNLNTRVDQISNGSPENSFYFQTSSLHFRHNRDHGSHQSRKPETGPLELSLRSAHHEGHSVLANPSTSHTTIDELERATADHDKSSFHVSTHSICDLSISDQTPDSGRPINRPLTLTGSPADRIRINVAGGYFYYLNNRELGCVRGRPWIHGSWLRVPMYGEFSRLSRFLSVLVTLGYLLMYYYTYLICLKRNRGRIRQ